MNPLQSEELSADLLRCSHCMRCGYELTGLDRKGACPECGLAFDPDTAVLEGEPCGAHAKAANRDGRYFVLVLIFSGLACFSGRKPPDVVTLSCLTMLALLGTFIASRWRWKKAVRQHEQLQGSVQCRFNCYGCVQCDQPEETVGVADVQSRMMWVTFVMGSLWAMVIFPAGRVIVIPMAVVSLCQRIIAVRRVRRHLLTLENFFPAGFHMATASRFAGWPMLPVSWHDVAEFEITPFTHGTTNRHRIIVSGRRGSKRIDWIDADVRCTEWQAAELRSRVAKWRAEIAEAGERQTGRF